MKDSSHPLPDGSYPPQCGTWVEIPGKSMNPAHKLIPSTTCIQGRMVVALEAELAKVKQELDTARGLLTEHVAVQREHERQLREAGGEAQLRFEHEQARREALEGENAELKRQLSDSKLEADSYFDANVVEAREHDERIAAIRAKHRERLERLQGCTRDIASRYAWLNRCASWQGLCTPLARCKDDCPVHTWLGKYPQPAEANIDPTPATDAGADADATSRALDVSL